MCGPPPSSPPSAGTAGLCRRSAAHRGADTAAPTADSPNGCTGQRNPHHGPVPCTIVVVRAQPYPFVADEVSGISGDGRRRRRRKLVRCPFACRPSAVPCRRASPVARAAVHRHHGTPTRPAHRPGPGRRRHGDHDRKRDRCGHSGSAAHVNASDRGPRHLSCPSGPVVPTDSDWRLRHARAWVPPTHLPVRTPARVRLPASRSVPARRRERSGPGTPQQARSGGRSGTWVTSPHTRPAHAPEVPVAITAPAGDRAHAPDRDGYRAATVRGSAGRPGAHDLTARRGSAVPVNGSCCPSRVGPPPGPGPSRTSRRRPRRRTDRER
jgi:hypothetical protein